MLVHGMIYLKHIKMIWQAFLMSWTGLTLWWLGGHAIVGEPRGAMLMFFMCGLLVAIEKLTLLDIHNRSVPDSAQ